MSVRHLILISSCIYTLGYAFLSGRKKKCKCALIRLYFLPTRRRACHLPLRRIRLVCIFARFSRLVMQRKPKVRWWQMASARCPTLRFVQILVISHFLLHDPVATLFYYDGHLSVIQIRERCVRPDSWQRLVQNA